MLRSTARFGLFVLLLGFTACTKDKNERLSDNGPKGNACTADVQKFCSSVEKGEGRVIRCLETHDGELSPGCRDLQRKRLVKLRNNEERETRLKDKAAGVPPPTGVCAADKPCKDSAKDTASVKASVAPVEDANVKMAKGGDKASEPGKTKKK